MKYEMLEIEDDGNPITVVEVWTNTKPNRSVGLSTIIYSASQCCKVSLVDDAGEMVFPSIYLTVANPTFNQYFVKSINGPKGSSVHLRLYGLASLSVVLGGEIT